MAAKKLPEFPKGGNSRFYKRLGEWAEAAEAELIDLRKQVAKLDTKREAPAKPETFAKSEEG